MSAAEMREALKPCPFCGGEAELWQAHPGRKAWVACMGRCAVLVTAEHQTNEEAIAVWNRRAPLPDEEGMVERAARAIAENEHACSIDGLEACRSRSNCQCYENARAAILAINGGNL